MPKRIGLLTGGGDCPGLNAAICSVVNHATGTYGCDVVGIVDSFKGLYKLETVSLSQSHVRGILDRGGTILGSSNQANPFAYSCLNDAGVVEVKDVSECCAGNYHELSIDGLIVIGGDGTQNIAHKMVEKGLRVVGIPKTIDNDLEGTEYTIGFQTAVDVACDAIDRLHSTAESHDRIMICEVMGRYAGWIAMHAGIAGGADVILIPEADYDIEKVIASIDCRRQQGISYSIVVVGEGAKAKGGGGHSLAMAGDATQQERLGGAGHLLERHIREHTDYDVRTTVLGHIQRGGTPSAFDRILASRFGVAAVDLLAAGSFGRVVAHVGGEIVDVSMEKATAKVKRVSPTGALAYTARSLGIELGY